MRQEGQVAAQLEDHRHAAILIIDDEESNVRLLERILLRAGYTNLRTITDPVGVLSLLDEFDPDLILLDLLMPQLDGFAVMGQLRSRAPKGVDLPILVLTADITPDTKRSSLAAGASDFLTKPFDQVEVLLRIRNLLESHFFHLQLRSQNELLEATVEERTRELRGTLEDLRGVDDQRRRLLSRLVQAQEEERRRLAGDLHDDPIQKMTAVGIRLEILRRYLTEPEQIRALEQVEDTVEGAIKSLRHLMFGLRPPALDREGLAAALAQHLELGVAEWGFDFRVDSRLIDEPPVEARAIAYRIVREALVNVRKHANATSVEVVLDKRDGGLFVRIKDDGVGLTTAGRDPQAGHLGLISMRERAELAGGWWRINGEPEAGTTVEFWLPPEVLREGVEGTATVAR